MTPHFLQSARDPVLFRPIGIIRSRHRSAERTPIQPVFARGCPGRAELLPAYREGLRDLEGFSHVLLLYHLHQAGPPRLIIRPFLGDRPCGVFSTRHPQRPNPIGLSLVRLSRIKGCVLYLLDVDILDGTPLLDIKPFVPRFDTVPRVRHGWTVRVSNRVAARKGRRLPGHFTLPA